MKLKWDVRFEIAHDLRFGLRRMECCCAQKRRQHGSPPPAETSPNLGDCFNEHHDSSV
jgi:hypothetical protein